MIGEKLYQLRRSRGLSQEQLAERIGVSRQTISKWEGGLSTPDLEKLIALADCFEISVDELVREKISAQRIQNPADETSLKADSPKTGNLGLVLCSAGALVLILIGLIMVNFPEVSNQVSDSSVITLDGRAIVMLLCAAVMVTGALLVSKGK